MKKISKKIFVLIGLLVFLSSCEEIIDVELDNADPQIVIEATVSDNPANNLVKITKSTDFYTPSEYQTVSNAEVIVTDPDGNNYNFIEETLGNYTNQQLEARVGFEYTISVKSGGEIYSAKSTLPTPIIVDSLRTIGEKRPFRDNLDYEYHLYFQDNPGIRDFLRFRLYINDKIKTGIFRYEDRLTDGNYIDFNRFFFRDDEDIIAGDKVTIEILTIDEATYEYFDTLRKVLASSGRGGGPGGGSTPANPTTNWNNGALGYFSAFCMDTKTEIIK